MLFGLARPSSKTKPILSVLNSSVCINDFIPFTPPTSSSIITKYNKDKNKTCYFIKKYYNNSKINYTSAELKNAACILNTFNKYNQKM